jgi:leucyl aminopeptidase
MWKLPLLEVRSTDSAKRDTDLVAVFQDTGKKAVPPRRGFTHLVEKLRKEDVFHAKAGSFQFIRFAPVDSTGSVLVAGLGSYSELTEEKLRASGGSAWSHLVLEKVREVTVHVETFFDGKEGKALAGHPKLEPARMIRAFAEGLILNAYQFDKYKTSQNRSHDGQLHGPSRIVFFVSEKALKAQLEHELKQVMAVGHSVRLTRDWSNEPSNYGTPVYYANEAKKLARQYGLKCKILTEADAKKEKMGLYLGVGQGAEREGRIVVLEYSPPAKKKGKTVALVGKGITFDSGGISIKPSLRMEEMKHDMTGAATVMGALILAAQWQVQNRVIGVLAFTENMPSGNAIQPGNILTARNGKTVEVINTDAEGRLILADALDFVQDFKPDAVVNIATLTGAVSVALGKQCCAVLGNDETLIETLRRAGEVNGEKMWQLPLFEEYFDDLKSDYADMKNSANDSNGGTIRGAIFLKQFIRKGTRWAHLDIAGVAYNLNTLTYLPKKGASGIYVRTLAQFAADF